MRVLDQLPDVLLEERDAILARWRARVLEIPAARRLDTPALQDHMPRFLDELVQALRRSEQGEPRSAQSPIAHGGQRFEDGFDIGQVVTEYHLLRTCVHEALEARAMGMQSQALSTFDCVIDSAIAQAVRTFADCQGRAGQRRRDEYLAFVAHDLRTPLNAITLAARMLELRWPRDTPDSDIARLRGTLIRNARHLELLVDNVLQENLHLLSELGIRLERRHFELWPLVQGAILDLQPLAEEAKTKLVNEVPDELQVHADAAVLRRVCQNLIANAIQHTPLGVVRIGARYDAGRAGVECWVADNGTGIPAERLGKVFEALETDPGRNGAGLGLAIVKTFVEAHGGSVSVESAPGQGCTLRFTLPRPGR